MVTTDEIEATIVRLHKENKTTREISKVVHKNFTYVGGVLRKLFPEEYTDNSTISKETEALKMFSEKKSPTEVAINLGWGFEQTEKVYLDYIRLERLYELYIIYKQYKQNLGDFLWFFKRLIARKTTRKDYKFLLGVIDKNRALDEELADFEKNVKPKFLNNSRPVADNTVKVY
jgi:hypothetical protein